MRPKKKFGCSFSKGAERRRTATSASSTRSTGVKPRCRADAAVDLVEVDPGAGLERNRAVAVLQQHQRSTLCRAGLVHERLLADHRPRGGFVDKRVLEQAELELLRQDPAHRLVQACLADCAGPHHAHQRRRVVDAAELIESGIDPVGEAIGNAERFHAPWHRDVGHGVRYRPVLQLSPQSRVIPQSDTITPSK